MNADSQAPFDYFVNHQALADPQWLCDRIGAVVHGIQRIDDRADRHASDADRSWQYALYRLQRQLPVESYRDLTLRGPRQKKFRTV